MHGKFWHARWRKNEIGFHETNVHPMLERHWARLGLAGASRVFVPLCGKSVDMVYLREAGHEVLGAELSDIAIGDFFAGQGLDAGVEEEPGFVRHAADGYMILCGDFFALTPRHLAGVRAVYDRAALIALPPEMRVEYVRHLRTLLAPDVPTLLITLDFPAKLISNPPFAVDRAEVARLYGDWCEIEELESSPSVAKGKPVIQTASLVTVRGGA